MSTIDAVAELQPREQVSPPILGAVIGTLLGFVDDGRTPLVTYPNQSGMSALKARTTLDLHEAHVGRQVVLLFEGGDPRLPIVMGCLRDEDGVLRNEHLKEIEIDVDGQRTIVTAKEQLVLRCGRASITLTKAGKVLIDGTYVLSRSAGTNRIKGGSVQLN